MIYQQYEKLPYGSESDQLFRKALYDKYVFVKATPIQEQTLWSLAWEYGHSSGYSEVESYYMDLVDLVNII